MKIVIPGEPIAKARHRSFIRHGHIATYDSQAIEVNDMRIKLGLAKESWDHKDLALKVDLIFQLDAQKGSSKAVSLLKRWNLCLATKKPDIDNLEKFALDCGNGILWADDRYIVELSSRKIYSNNPCTIINIEAINEDKMSAKHEQVFKIFSPEDLDSFANDTRRINDIMPLVPVEDAGIAVHQMTSTADLLINFATKWHEKLRKIKEK